MSLFLEPLELVRQVCVTRFRCNHKDKRLGKALRRLEKSLGPPPNDKLRRDALNAAKSIYQDFNEKVTQPYGFCRCQKMTELLRQAIAQIQQLPPDQQDAIASRFLAELQDEQKWESRFAATTDDQWDQMAAMVRQEEDSECVSLFVCDHLGKKNRK